MPVVRQRQERVAPPPLRRVLGLDPPGPATVETGGEGLRVKAPEGAAVRNLWRESATGAVLEFLQNTSVGRRLPVRVARGPREEEAGEGAVSEGEEGDLGPP